MTGDTSEDRRDDHDPKHVTYRDIPGWFHRMDVDLFRGILAAQADTAAGDLVELGVYQGKSAVVIGEALRPGERFVAVDLFGDMSLLPPAVDKTGAPRSAEKQPAFSRLTRASFEDNYLSVHDELPVVVQAPSASVLEHVAAGGARFVHIDAAHLYRAVADDIRSAKIMLRPGGVVVFDDWSNASWPGVAAAVWEAVISDRLIPIATTKNKLYAVWSEAEEATAAVRAVLASRPDWWLCDEREVLGHTVLRLDNRARRDRRARRRAASSEAASPRTRRGRAAWKRAPSALVRSLRRSRRARERG